jgi:hypothetical protein
VISANTIGRLLLTGLVTAVIGCEAPKRIHSFPAGTLPVLYEPATTHSTCLVASLAMSANYLLGERRFSEKQMRTELKQAGKDETLTRDLKDYLETKGLYLIALTGQIDGKPPSALSYWVVKRGYPAICIINREPGQPAFNHAVVVIGISPTSTEQSADIIHYLDPATPEPLQSCNTAEFERLWAAAEYAMLLVVAPPPESPAPSQDKQEKP